MARNPKARAAAAYTNGLPQLAATLLRSRSRGARVLAAAALASRPPQGLGWPNAYPFVVVRSPTGWTANIDERSFVSGPFGSTATVYYVDPATGNNANSGLSTGAKMRDINAAITAGNATGGPYRVYCTAGRYTVLNSCNSGSGAIQPTQDAAFIAVGGRVNHAARDPITWPGTPDATYTNCYKATRSGIASVWDRLTPTSDGDYTQLVNVADAATCNTTPGSWVQVGSDLYVRRADGAAVTETNTQTLVTSNVHRFNSGSPNLYFEGFDFEGSLVGAPYVSGGTRNVVTVDCTHKYVGRAGNLVDGWRMENVNGFCLAVRCDASANAKDGFNVHNSIGTTYSMTVNCTGGDNGRYGSTTNQCLTVHETNYHIDIGSTWSPSQGGGTLTNVDSAKMWVLGSSITADAGSDEGQGSAAVNMGNTTQTWLQDCTLSASGSVVANYALLIQQTSIVLTRNVRTLAGTNSVAAGATLGTF